MTKTAEHFVLGEVFQLATARRDHVVQIWTMVVSKKIFGNNLISVGCLHLTGPRPGRIELRIFEPTHLFETFDLQKVLPKLE